MNQGNQKRQQQGYLFQHGIAYYFYYNYLLRRFTFNGDSSVGFGLFAVLLAWGWGLFFNFLFRAELSSEKATEGVLRIFYCSGTFFLFFY